MALYRVIKIIDDMKLVVNCGVNQEIKIGDKFYIYSKETEKIIDPFTGEILDELPIIKAEIEAVEIYKKMCICQNAKRNFAFTDVTKSLLTTGLNERFSLNVDPSQISGGFQIQKDEMIQIGDDVEKIN